MTLEAFYTRAYGQPTAIREHLPRLRAMGAGTPLVVEFGVKRGASSSAWLLGADRVISYDLIATPEARELQTIAGDRWDYRLADSRTAPVEPCDLLFIDSLHTYQQMQAELERHADAVRHWLVCHDSLTFGSIGAAGETGRHAWSYLPGRSVPPWALGIRPALDELMIRDRTWQIAAHDLESHGLLVLERVS